MAVGDAWRSEVDGREHPIADEIPVVLPLPDFAVRMIEPTVALVACKGWLMEFHQGTPVPEGE